MTRLLFIQMFFSFLCFHRAGEVLKHQCCVPSRRLTIGLVGGSGFLGSRTALRLSESGFHVRIISRQPHQIQKKVKTENVIVEEGFARATAVRRKSIARSNIREFVGKATKSQQESVKLYMEFLPVSLGGKDEEAELTRALSGCDGVVNFVGILAEGMRRGSFETLHHKGAGKVAAVAKKAGVKRLIHVSAIGANENSDSVYARTKALGEQAVLREFPSSTIFRPSLVVGRGDGFFGMFDTMSRYSPFLPLIGGGVAKFQPVHIDDVTEAIVASFSSGATQGKTYELGGPDVYTFKELLQLFMDFNKRKRLLLPIPVQAALLQGLVFENLPGKLITRDQVRLLQYDNVVSPDALSFKDLDMADLLSVTEALEDIFSYRRHG